MGRYHDLRAAGGRGGTATRKQRRRGAARRPAGNGEESVASPTPQRAQSEDPFPSRGEAPPDEDLDDERGAPPIRVLLAGLPELLAGVIAQAVGAEGDMRVVGHARDSWELLQLAARGADVLVLGAAPVYPLPGICRRLLAELPGLKILVVDPSGTEAMRYWMAVRRARGAIPTQRRLVGTIRGLARRGEF